MKKFIILSCFIIGLYAPTSSHSIINNTLPLIWTCLLLPLYLLYLYRDKKMLKINFFIGTGILVVLGIATFFTPFFDYAFGNIVYYSAFVLLLCMNIRDIELKKNDFRIINGISIVNVVLCLLVIMQNEVIIRFFIDNYSLFYSEMNLYALYSKKPVIMFAAHSIAAFYLYLFFYMNFLFYKQKNNWFHLVLTISYAYFIFSVGSNTAYFFAAIALVQLIYYFARNKFNKFVWAVMALIVFLAFNISRVADVFTGYYTRISLTLGSTGNGLQGRFSSQGVLADNLNYLSENILRPVGMGNSSELFFGDSGLITHLLRGSLLAVVLIYAGFYFLLKANIKSHRIAAFVWVLFILMEIGYSALINFRTLFLLPFIIVIINNITNVNKPLKTQKGVVQN